ncbi:MAG: zinc-binding alcohol dehydrogenase [Armatimonadetes bacterium]|nr:zinc-binding alcohol dehydrogenase [Armatimonadota bacterium]
MPQRVVFTKPNEIRLESFESQPLAPDEVRIITQKSIISPGTELRCLRGDFAPGTHWAHWVKYPFCTGYCSIGEISEVGSMVEGFSEGDRVTARCFHASENVAHVNQLAHIPDEISDDDAVFYALGMITFMGAKNTEWKTGDRVLCIGAGPIGQLSVRWAFAGGCSPIVVLDPVESRLQLAQRGGAHKTILSSAAHAKDAVLEAFDGELPDIVIDTTGSPAVFPHALNLTRSHGKVLLIGDVGDPSQQVLTPDVVLRGVKIIGAHVQHETARWPEKEIIRLFFSLIADHRIDLSGLISHRFSIEECDEAFALLQKDPASTMGVVFEYS